MSHLKEKHFTFHSKDQREIFVYYYCREDMTPKGIIQISHGMAETAARYKDFARELTQNGYLVFANDHRGHGKSADSLEEQGYLGEKNGFSLLVSDIAHLTNLIRKDYPSLPIYLFSHSMGSFASQEYIMRYPDKIDGLILSGSNGEQGIALTGGKIISKIEMMIRGKKAKSKLMNYLTFGHYNKNFQPEVTGVEWLTRDKNEQIKYLNNPYCGSIFPASFYYDFLNHLQYIENEDHFDKIPKNIPIYILSGDQDPVGDFGRGISRLKDRYEKCGVKDLTSKLYEGARHELLNEINRTEIIEDIIQWLNKRVEARVDERNY